MSNTSSIVDCNVSANCYGYQGAGFRIWDCAHTVLVDSCTISNNIYGIWVSNASPLIRHSYLGTNEADGVYVTSYASQIPTNPRLEWCEIDGSTENGIYFYYKPGEISNTKIWQCGIYGILCQGQGANPTIDHSKIINNQSAGVRANSDGAPILGIVSLGLGQNNSLYGQNKNVYNASSLVTVNAENCWWGAAPPDPTKFYGSIINRPYLQSDPVMYLAPNVVARSTIVALALDQNFPNPFWDCGVTTISYGIPRGSGKVALMIYDVAGRRVRSLVDNAQAPGRHFALWDGRNERGVLVAPGVYFYRLTVGAESISKKLMLFR